MYEKNLHSAFYKNEYSLIEFLPPEYVITSLITPMGIGIGQDISVMRNSF